MATINFLIQGKNSPAHIYVRFRNGRALDLKAKTIFTIAPDDWSMKKGEPRSRNEFTKHLKESLEKLRTRLLEQFNFAQENGEEINQNWLRGVLSNKATNGKTNSLIEYYDIYRHSRGNGIAPSTARRLVSQKAILELFEQTLGYRIKIKDVNLEFKRQFEDYCLAQNYSINTIASSLKILKTICNFARLDGIETSLDIERFKIIKEPSYIIYLTEEEIQQIENAQIESEALNNSRDWLIISCETGQRVSDFLRFNEKMLVVRTTQSGNVRTFIEFEQMKTKRKMSIPLTNRVINILEKHGGSFPRRLCASTYNLNIKEVCRLSGIDEVIEGAKNNPLTNRKVKGKFPKYELISSHVGRRSFSSNRYGKIPTAFLIYATGHSTESMFLNYIGKSDTAKSDTLADYL
jgi:site-specific recombinase XerD